MYDIILIQNEFSIIGINTQGGYVTSWKAKSATGEFKDILYIGSTIRRTGIPILFPYYGKAKQTRMHGIGRDSLWRIIQSNQNALTMELTTGDLDKATQAEYPFNFVATISILPDATTSAFDYILSVTNNDSQAIPVSPGLHPYWKIPHQEKNKIKITGIKNFDATKIDWENNPPDTPYLYTQPVTAQLQDKKITIEDLSGNLKVKYIQIWSQTPIRDPDFDFICIEPICGLNYGIDESPLLIEPQETWEMKIRFSVTDA